MTPRKGSRSDGQPRREPPRRSDAESGSQQRPTGKPAPRREERRGGQDRAPKGARRAEPTEPTAGAAPPGAGPAPRAGVHAIPGRHPVEEALRARRRLQEILVERLEGNEALLDAARQAGVPVRRAAREDLDAAAWGVLHQGVVAVAPAYPYVDLHQAAQGEVVVVLDGVTDPQNLGSVARSAVAAGARGLVLPKRRSAHVTPAAEKASAGALSWLPVAVVPNIVRALADLAEHGFWSVGLAGDAATGVWDSRLLDGKVAVVVGAEGAGLSRLVAERVDELVRIPMAAHAESLNAAVAAAVVLFEVARRRAGAPRADP